MGMSGDCRKYFVPCPFCGEYQTLDWTTDEDKHGLRADMDSGNIVRVYYVCKHCQGEMQNHHKTIMLLKGQWRPTSKSTNKYRRSYQLSSLYSPVGMLSWREMYEKYLEAIDEEEDGMRSFTNLYLGMPYKESGARPRMDTVIELRSGYRSETVPDGVLFLTAGIDVQRGSKKDPDNPPRLEMEVCGHGSRYRTWSICYKRFEGDVTDPSAGAWEKLKEYMDSIGYCYKRDDGQEFNVEYILVDSGDGETTNVVYEFCGGWMGTHPSKGYGALKKRKEEKGDEVGPLNFKKYRKVKINEDTILHEISTNFYKTTVYNNLVKMKESDKQQPAGLCEFPVDYKDSYFKMLTAEEKRRDGSFHCPTGRRNEALDCRVMNLCAGHSFLDAKLAAMKKLHKDQGSSNIQIASVNHRMVLAFLEMQKARKK
jgi:phage terminase large subunit GpA-like protein